MQGNMTRAKLKKLLEYSMLFSKPEVRDILRLAGTYTVGNAIQACGAIGINLAGNDIDILINTLFYDEEV